jgi:hypothetical protein
VAGPNRVRVSEFGAVIAGELRRASLRYRGGLGEAARQLAVGGSTTRRQGCRHNRGQTTGRAHRDRHEEEEAAGGGHRKEDKPASHRRRAEEGGGEGRSCTVRPQ